MSDHIIGRIDWTWLACCTCANDEQRGGNCDGEVATRQTDDGIACDDYEEADK